MKINLKLSGRLPANISACASVSSLLLADNDSISEMLSISLNESNVFESHKFM